MGRDIARFELHGPLPGGDRFSVLPQSFIDTTQTIVALRIVGSQICRLLPIGQRLLVRAGIVKCKRDIVTSVPVQRVQNRGLPPEGQCCFAVVQVVAEYQTEIIEGVGVLRVKLDRAPPKRCGLFVLTLSPSCRRHLPKACHVIGIHRKRLLPSAHRHFLIA